MSVSATAIALDPSGPQRRRAKAQQMAMAQIMEQVLAAQVFADGVERGGSADDFALGSLQQLAHIRVQGVALPARQNRDAATPAAQHILQGFGQPAQFGRHVEIDQPETGKVTG